MKDSLGGNAKTGMLATVSPSIENYDESLSTLRYAHNARSIVNEAKVNEDPNAALIRELRAEVEALRAQILLENALKKLQFLSHLSSGGAKNDELTQYDVFCYK